MNTSTNRDRSPMVTIDGVTKTARQWAEEKDLKWSTVATRYQQGKTWEEALQPLHKGSASAGSKKSSISAAAAKRMVGRKPVPDNDEPSLAEQIKTTTVTVGNETKTVEEWMVINGVNITVLRNRRMFGATWLEAIRSLKEAKEARHQAHHRSALAATLDNEARRVQQVVIPEK